MNIYIYYIYIYIIHIFREFPYVFVGISPWTSPFLFEVFQAISKVVVEAQQCGIIASPPPIVGRIHQEMGLGMTKLQNAMTPGSESH